MLYVTAPNVDALFQVDPSAGTIKNKTTLGNCTPVGLAINPRTDQALIACNNWTLGWDFRTSTPTTFNQASHADIVSYDPKTDRYLIATPGPITSSSVAIFGGNPIGYVASVDTGAGGNAAVYDDTNNVVYTTDLRPNRVGLIVLVLIIVGRQADPIRRPEPLLTRAEARQARLERLKGERPHDPSQA
jgi:hypothetical protein